jgi:hypothetical protein
MHPTFEDGDNYVWLLKPTDLNRGRGIQLFNNLENLEKLLMEFKNGAINEYQGSNEEPVGEKDKESGEKPKLYNQTKIKS